MTRDKVGDYRKANRGSRSGNPRYPGPPQRLHQTLGAALKGDEQRQFWKYRLGDYRVIEQIRYREIRIVVVRIGHRREIHR